ncbi:MAG: ATP-binding cassette domain-containing protein [Firmicutes bacterium]|nr:ATP-binding cassette domain-containing protein [Bacillota bacterium]
MLRCRSVTHRYGRRIALTGIDLTVGTEIYGLLGNNGAGKSTLMKIVGTAMLPTSGEVVFETWRRPKDDLRIRAELGYLPQIFGLPGHVTAREYLRYAAVMKGLDPRHPDASPDHALERVGLAAAADRRISAMSGGMRQRLGIAVAFLGRPRLLVLDEPTAGLDPDERVRFRHLIREAQATAAVLFSTHIVSDVERDATRVGIMHAGAIVAEGRPGELAERARGSVFEVRVDREAWRRLAPSWMRRERDPRAWPGVIASVTEGQDPEAVTVRVVSTAPPRGDATPVSPSLEDAYLLFTALLSDGRGAA